MLRTSFDLIHYSEPLQLVHETATFPIQEDDIQYCTAVEQERIIRCFVEEERNNRFDITHAPLLRLHIHRRTNNSFQFTITEYHPILDGWSLHSIFAEIFNAYMLILEHKNVGEVTSLETSFRDFVALEKMALQSDVCMRYWESKLADSHRLELPKWVRSDIKSADPRYGKVTMSIPSDVSEGLRQFARSANVSLKSVLFAVHVKVMSILSGQNDILTGQLSNGRLEVVDGERVVGLFLNTLPLRLTVAPGTWLELVQQAFDAECDILPFRRYPLAEMQKRWGGRTPLLNTAFNYFDFYVFNDLFASGQMEHLGFKIISHNVGFVLNALFFASAPDRKSSQIFFDLAYEAALLDETIARQVGDYYVAVMKAIVANPLEEHEQVDALSSQEKQTLLKEWNATTVEYKSNLSVHHLFETQVKQTPDDVAVIFEQQQLTYHLLNTYANQLAHYLQHRGVGPEVRVGVCVERSMQMVISLLAILKAGGVYVPLDPSYPQERLAFMVRDAQIAVLLVQPAQKTLLPASIYEDTSLCILDLDDEAARIAQEPTDNSKSRVMSDHLAYIIYTSGSTGLPKGVMIEHRSICNRLLWMQDMYQLASTDHVLQKTPFSFDVSVWEFLWPLITGAQLVVARPGGHRDSAYLVNLIAQQRITVLHFVPSMLRVFLEEENIDKCSNLKYILCSGEALSADILKKCCRRLPNVVVDNLYGPTEVAIDVTQWRGECIDALDCVPIGKPIANTQAYVLDRSLQLVPVGTAGELYLGGIQLARGYHRRPAITAEKFIPNPFSQTAGARLYRTGDFVRYLPHGDIEFLGRLDQQVKIRGFRIELEEIESILLQHPHIQQGAVVAREDISDDKRLVAYIVGDRALLSLSEIRDTLKKHLPDYMIPSYFVWLDALPLTVNGKLDHLALPAPDAIRPELEETYVAPRTEYEILLAQIWSDILRVQKVGIYDNFFELGGDSLLSIQVNIQAYQKGLQLTLNQISMYQTIAELATVVQKIS